MGITGLIPFLRNASSPSNISDFNGCTAAVDVYCWIHKGCFKCYDQLYNGEDTDDYVNFIVDRTELLIKNGVKPILVFDGQNLLAKELTETKRRESRYDNRQGIGECLERGDIEKANKLMQRCVDVTQYMAKKVIDACRCKNYDYIVAPYEADAQIAYLVNEGFAHLAITEDSDLLVFGCQLCFFKMDYTGNGLLINMSKMNQCLGPNFTPEKFRRMCILSGCDYLPNLPQIGLIRAKKFFEMTDDSDLSKCLYRIPNYLKMTNRLKVTKEYVENFIKADNTFKHQLVFCPLKKKLVPLTPYDDNISIDDMQYAGEYFDDDHAYQFAIGNVDTSDGNVIDVYKIESFYEDSKSIWFINYKKPKRIKSIKEIDHSVHSQKSNSFTNIKSNVTVNEKKRHNEKNVIISKKSKSDVKVNGFASTYEMCKNTLCDEMSTDDVANGKSFITESGVIFRPNRNIFKVNHTVDATVVQSRFFTKLSSIESESSQTSQSSQEECESVQSEDVESLKRQLIDNVKCDSSVPSSLCSSGETVISSEGEYAKYDTNEHSLRSASSAASDDSSNDSLHEIEESYSKYNETLTVTELSTTKESDTNDVIIVRSSVSKRNVRQIGISKRSKRQSDIRNFMEKFTQKLE